MILQEKGYWEAYFWHERTEAVIQQQLMQGSEVVEKESGDYDEDGRDYLKKVMQIVDLEFKVKRDKSGYTSEGMVWTVGSNTNGVLGLGDDKEFSLQVRTKLTFRTFLSQFV